MFAELLGIGETIASLANETVAQGEISRVVERGLDNPQIFQNLVHFYGELREPYYPGPKDPN